ncbi:2-oxoglutarate/2-oxoacid ferredoxin oxidoreductase subunit beta [Phycisphaerales bacterium]|nr:2-oxoglutarate/2-oxoacid ferredoxin oxidoreductase subunit beta [Phycisphaerales bacterium]
MSDQHRRFLRLRQLPHVWCPGCGNGSIVKALLTAIGDLGLDQDRVAVISGIGCAGRAPFILDFNTMHTTHGRALAFATGMKLVNPDLKVIVIMGDGDASAIGGNHFIHSCRRNLDLTALVFNNGIYGLTGGQLAPTTPAGKRSTTSMSGNIEHAFDLVRLALGAGAGFVARTTSYDNKQMVTFFKRAISHKGFAFVDVMTACPTYFGRMNDLGEPYELLHYLRDTTSPSEDIAREHDESPPADLMPTGIFRDEERRDYGTLYSQRALATSGKGRS